ncbi:MAG: hypothetical protein ACT4OK_06285 [Gemmobacter sp.]
MICALIALYAMYNSVGWLRQAFNLPPEATLVDVAKSAGDTVAQLLGMFVALAATVVFTVLIWRKDKHFRQNVWLVVLLIATMVLTFVSFLTTMFGLLGLISDGTDAQAGTTAVFGYAVAFGTTFGVQFTMLVMAVLAGDQIARHMRMMPGAAHQAVLKDQKIDPDDPPAVPWRDIAGWLVFGVLVALVLAVSGLMRALYDSVLVMAGSARSGQGYGRYGLAFLLAMAALVLFLALVNRRRFGGRLVTVLTLAVYFAALSVSSGFSFASYHDLFQRGTDAEIRRVEIVRQDTSQLIIDAGDELTDWSVEYRADGDEIKAIRAVIEPGLDQLRVTANGAVDTLQTAAAQSAQKAAEDNAAAEKAIAEAQQQIKDLLAGVSNLTRAVTQAEAAETLVKNELAAHDAKITAAEGVLQASITERDAKKAEWDKELAEGDPTTGRVAGIGSVSRRLEREHSGLARTVEANEEALRALREARLEIEARRTAATTAADEARRLAAGAAGGGVPADVQRRIDKLQSDISGLQTAIDRRNPTVALASGVSADAATTAFAEFRETPTEATRSAFVTECESLTAALVTANFASPGGDNFSCNRPEFGTYLARLEANAAAIASFNETCTREARLAAEAGRAATAPAAPVVAADTLVKASIDTARTCLNLADVGSLQIRALSDRLIELADVYGGTGADIRRSVEDLKRGEFWAVAAALLALFLDVLILIVGAAMAFLRKVPLAEDPVDLDPAEIEERLLQFGRKHARSGDPGETFERIVALLQPGQALARQHKLGPEFMSYIPDDLDEPTTQMVDQLVTLLGGGLARQTGTTGEQDSDSGTTETFLHNGVINFLHHHASPAMAFGAGTRGGFGSAGGGFGNASARSTVVRLGDLSLKGTRGAAPATVQTITAATSPQALPPPSANDRG